MSICADFSVLGRHIMFQPLAPLLQQLAPSRKLPDCARLNQLQDNLDYPAPVTASGQSLHFCAQDPLEQWQAQAYERCCYLTGRLPTRQNWHDILNALVWMTFPQTKARINQLHVRSLSSTEQDDSERGWLRDRLTLFDETGVLIISDDVELLQWIEQFRWKTLFWTQRQRCIRHLRVFLFGHGLYEKALAPYVGMTGQAMLLPVESELLHASWSVQRDRLDQSMDAELMLRAESGIRRKWSPFPVLGMPGWDVDNQHAAYYDNQAYFRPGRRYR